MGKKIFTVGSFAKLTGITERALRYYDRKGLLTPSAYNQQGHRLYTHDNLVEVQKILTLKYLGYSLEEIAEHLENSGKNIMDSLTEQTNLLQQKRNHIDQVLNTINRVQSIVEEQSEQPGAELLLGLIHIIQHEDEQREMIGTHVSPELLAGLFMEEKSSEEKLELERKVIAIFTEVSQFYHENKPKEDIAVQAKVGELLELLTEVFKPEQLDELEDVADGPGNEPLFIINMLTSEVEEYLTDAIMIYEENSM